MKWVNRILAGLLVILLITGGGLLGMILYYQETRLHELSERCLRLESELEEMGGRAEELSGELEQLRAAQEAAGRESEETQLQTETGTTEILTEGTELPEAGTLIPEAVLGETGADSYFQSYEISDAVFARIYGKSYKEYCTVPREDLRYLKVLHYDFDHNVRVGELMVNAGIAEDCLEIFRELYRSEYEICSMYLIDNYDADDYASIEANNTSAFNYRNATGSSNLSNHALGLAIDINPQQNPYVESDGTYYHANAAEYIDRTRTDVEHMITHEDLCYQLFTARGFTWGGDWSSPRDYQHFEKKL